MPGLKYLSLGKLFITEVKTDWLELVICERPIGNSYNFQYVIEYWIRGKPNYGHGKDSADVISEIWRYSKWIVSLWSLPMLRFEMVDQICFIWIEDFT